MYGSNIGGREGSSEGTSWFPPTYQVNAANVALMPNQTPLSFAQSVQRYSDQRSGIHYPTGASKTTLTGAESEHETAGP